jgi:hypothetical protein
MNKKIAGVLSIMLGFILAIICIKTFLGSGETVKFDQVGLGEATLPYFPEKNGLPIHIDSVANLPLLIKNAKENAHGKDLLLWLGNSQLFGVNQIKPGDKNSVEYLYDTLLQYNKFTIAYSLPNANLEEHYVVFKYLLHELPVKQLTIPVFFDDTRESDLRDDLLQDQLKKAVLQDLDSSELSKALVTAYGAQHENNGDNGDMKALNHTTQESVEKYLNEKLGGVSSIWKGRAALRSTLIYYYIFKIRNSALGITPSSKRKKILSRYEINMKAFEAICELAKKKHIAMLVYVPPIRNDVEQPYVKQEYEDFKKDLLTYRQQYGFTFYNAESIVPANLWGMKASTTLGKEKLEVDFMHFQSRGHHLLADSLASIIIKNK